MPPFHSHHHIHESSPLSVHKYVDSNEDLVESLRHEVELLRAKNSHLSDQLYHHRLELSEREKENSLLKLRIEQTDARMVSSKMLMEKKDRQIAYTKEVNCDLIAELQRITNERDDAREQVKQVNERKIQQDFQLFVVSDERDHLAKAAESSRKEKRSAKKKLAHVEKEKELLKKTIMVVSMERDEALELYELSQELDPGVEAPLCEARDPPFTPKSFDVPEEIIISRDCTLSEAL